MPRAEKGSRKDVVRSAPANAILTCSGQPDEGQGPRTPALVVSSVRKACVSRHRHKLTSTECRDENGFKCHAQSEGHLRAMLAVGKRAGSQVAQYSNEFERNFMQILSRRYGTTRVKANNVYQEVISDKHHTHMNATRWVTMTEFCFSMARAGKMKVEDTEKCVTQVCFDSLCAGDCSSPGSTEIRGRCRSKRPINCASGWTWTTSRGRRR